MNTDEKPGFSPFCTKVEAFLRFNELPYERRYRRVQTAPKGKLPVVQVDGELLDDSDLIIEALSKKYNIDMDGHLSPRERATSLALRKLMEEHLTAAGMYYRWVHPDYWPKTRDAYFKEAPWFVRRLVTPLVRRKIIRDVKGHGMGRHSPEEVLFFAERAIKALADFLGERPYFMGDKLSLVDLTAFAAGWSLARVPLDSPLKELWRAQENLMAYVERVWKEYWVGHPPRAV